eukprot:GGOE01018956.1.p1 GENE.GGOE01018956.1~~GGOE01018956.1.p1  ORF type:complete len:776 (+),score=186.88 GGOE01018956.1:187-2328(+)
MCHMESAREMLSDERCSRTLTTLNLRQKGKLHTREVGVSMCAPKDCQLDAHSPALQQPKSRPKNVEQCHPTTSWQSQTVAGECHVATPVGPKLADVSSSSDPVPKVERTKVTAMDIARVMAANLWPDRWDLRLRVLATVALVVFARFLHISIPFCLKVALDKMSGKPLRAVPWGLWHVPIVAQYGILPIVLFYGITRLAYAACNEAREYVLAPVSNHILRQTGAQVFSHLLHSDPADPGRVEPGEVALMLEKGYQGLHVMHSGLLFNLLPTMAELGYVGYLMFFQLGGNFATLGAAIAASYSLWTLRMTKEKATHRKKCNHIDRKSSGKVIDTLLNLDEVRFFQSEKRETQQYDELRKGRSKESYKLERAGAMLKVGQAAVYTSALTLSLAMSASQVAAGRLTVGDVMLVNQMIFQLAKPLSSMGTAFNHLVAAVTDMSRMVQLLRTQPAIKDAPNARDLLFNGGRIDFKQVTICDERAGRTILNRTSFTIEPGSTVAIVGPSGCGKSTIVRSLFRFLKPRAGQILIDGQDIELVKLASLRRHISVVPQDPGLFSNTFRHNIGYGNPDASDAEIEAAARKAAIHDVIMSTPAGYETPIGPKGRNLSAGEQQRVALARALLKPAPILVLDEATSALDIATEAAVLRALRAATARTTCILVAHRLSNIKLADRILVLNADGVVEEEGTHDFLMAQRGTYYRMWKEQERTEGTSVS